MHNENLFIKLILEGYDTKEEARDVLNQRPDLVEKNATVIQGGDGLFYVALSKTLAKQAGYNDYFDV